MRRAGPISGSHRSKEAGVESPQCLVVMYHYVRDRDPIAFEGIAAINPREFEDQIDRLCEALEPIDWPALLAWSDGRGSIPQRCFLLTFDDGLADHARAVLPVLERQGLRGVFFVPGEVLARQWLLPAHEIHLLLANLGHETLQWELERYLKDHDPDNDWPARIDIAEAESMYHYEPPQRAHLKYLLTMVLPRDLRRRVLDAMFIEHIGSPSRWSNHWYLGWDDLTDMQSMGHTIGGHGHCHEPLTSLQPAQCRRDMQMSAAVLNEGLGRDIRPFSYPFGRFTDDISNACRDAGFVHAFTTERSLLTASCDQMRWPRIDTIYVDAELKERFPCTPV